MTAARKLIPYAGKDSREQPLGWTDVRLQRKALRMFKEGLDTDQIAYDLDLEECVVANALAVARDAERRR